MAPPGAGRLVDDRRAFERRALRGVDDRDAVSGEDPKLDQRLCDRRVAEHQQLGLRRMWFEVNLELAPAVTSHGDHHETFAIVREGRVRRDLNDPTGAIGQRQLCLLLDGRLGAASADPAGARVFPGRDEHHADLDVRDASERQPAGDAFWR